MTRCYEDILKSLQDKTKSDLEVFNRTGGMPGADPEEALATMKAIGIYRRNTDFAEHVRRCISNDKDKKGTRP